MKRQVIAVLGLLAMGLMVAPPPPAHAETFPLSAAGVPTLAPILQKVTPAVVNIAVKLKSQEEDNPLMRDPFFRRFFNMPENQAEQPPRAAAGSGVIVDAQHGYVLTNNHVVANAQEIEVTLKDRRRLAAKLIGTDPATDIAVLKIPAENLTALPFGDSKDLQVGDFVIAIGNPFGLGQTVTSGIVSALGRSGINIEGYEDFIQTDAPINPGNSGGALVNLQGELIGINTAIIAPAGGNVGIGFAVPSDMAKAVMTQLIEHGEIKRGRLGVVIQDVTPDLAEAFHLENPNGAVVTAVEPGSPADKAGLKTGDVIVSVDGKQVENASDLRNHVGLVPIGQKVEIGIVRSGHAETITARVEAPSTKNGGQGEGVTVPRLSGAVFRDIAPGSPLYGRVDGIVVTGVEEGSKAFESGLRNGDIILAVNRTRVDSVDTFQKLVEQSGPAVALNVLRGDVQIFIVVQ